MAEDREQQDQLEVGFLDGDHRVPITSSSQPRWNVEKIEALPPCNKRPLLRTIDAYLKKGAEKT